MSHLIKSDNTVRAANIFRKHGFNVFLNYQEKPSTTAFAMVDIFAQKKLSNNIICTFCVQIYDAVKLDLCASLPITPKACLSNRIFNKVGAQKNSESLTMLTENNPILYDNPSQQVDIKQADLVNLIKLSHQKAFDDHDKPFAHCALPCILTTSLSSDAIESLEHSTFIFKSELFYRKHRIIDLLTIDFLEYFIKNINAFLESYPFKYNKDVSIQLKNIMLR